MDAIAFQASCAHDDHEWPRFANAEELLNSSWAAYFMSVYGEVPTDAASFPICTFDFWHIDAIFLKTANISGIRPVLKRSQQSYNDRRYNWTDGELYLKHSRWSSYYKQWTKHAEYSIYHSDRPYAESNQWIEVAHRSQGYGLTGERVGMWLAYARGSGIWYWTGRHRLYDTHFEAIVHLCGQRRASWLSSKSFGDDELARCAVASGIDTISFRTSRPDPPNVTCVYDKMRCKQHVSVNGTMSTWGLVGLYELMATNLSGMHACGAREGGSFLSFRAGWRASKPCSCNHHSIFLNCDGVPRDVPLQATGHPR